MCTRIYQEIDWPIAEFTCQIETVFILFQGVLSNRGRCGPRRYLCCRVQALESDRFSFPCCCSDCCGFCCGQFRWKCPFWPQLQHPLGPLVRCRLLLALLDIVFCSAKLLIRAFSSVTSCWRSVSGGFWVDGVCMDLAAPPRCLSAAKKLSCSTAALRASLRVLGRAWCTSSAVPRASMKESLAIVSLMSADISGKA